MSSTTSQFHDSEARVPITINIVNWDALSSLAHKLYHVDSSHWGEQTSGGYNLIRFLHLHDSLNTTLVARVPLRPEDAMTAQQDLIFSKRIENEVATLHYVESHTNIPVPHVIHYSSRPEGDVRSAYILMSKVEGFPLGFVWNGMDDAKRKIILRQVVDILLELWSHRFDKPGVLLKRSGCGDGKDNWYIESSSVIAGPNTTESRHHLATTSYANAADYWLGYANAYLNDKRDARFGSAVKSDDYAQAWFMRSLIPSLYDPSLDTHGYPLSHGDLSWQNIMITDVDDNPRITALIDWESSGPGFVTTFAKYPPFIVDNFLLAEDHPLRKQNMQDQATFDELILEAERRRNPVLGIPLSHLVSKSYPIHIFEQAMCDDISYCESYPLLFRLVFGDEDISPDYYSALMEKGVLKQDTEQFEEEYQVCLEAREVLGDDVVGRDLRRGEFKDLVLKHLDRFENDGRVLKWLASVPPEY